MKNFVSILLALALALSVLLLPQNTQANSPRFEKPVVILMEKGTAVTNDYLNVFKTKYTQITNDFPKEENMIQSANKYGLVFNGIRPNFVKLE